MRFVKIVALLGTLGLIGVVQAASAAPIIPNPGFEQHGNVVQVAGGCGRGWHPNRWGRCAPNRYGYYGYYRPRPYWSRPYYGWHSPSDFAANDLNRRQLGRYPW
jgi:hypothetical protein